MMHDPLDYDPFHPDQLFWDEQEFGPTVTAQEREMRAVAAHVALLAWDDMRRQTVPGRIDLLYNLCCGYYVAAFGQAMKLPDPLAVQYMDDLATRRGQDLHAELRRALQDMTRRDTVLSTVLQ